MLKLLKLAILIKLMFVPYHCKFCHNFSVVNDINDLNMSAMKKFYDRYSLSLSDMQVSMLLTFLIRH